MVHPIEFVDYDKITDTVYELGQKMVLEMVVSLSRKNDTTGDRYHYHKEFRYDSKYSSRKMVSIKRLFDYYLQLVKIDTPMSGIMIRVQDMYLVLAKLKEALKWFETAGVFGVKSGTRDLYIKTSQPPIIIPELTQGKYIQLDPVVIVYESTGMQTQGIRVTLGNMSIFSDVPMDRFYGLVYIMSNLDIYCAAQNMVNYLQRPEYGTNLREFEENQFLTPHEEKNVMVEGMKNNRDIRRSGKPRTFFDNIDSLS